MTHRHRTQRTGLMTLACLLGTTLAALAIARFGHLGVAGTLVQFLVGGGALASLYLAWATYRAAHVPGEAVPSTEQMADELAAAVHDQWQPRPGHGASTILIHCQSAGCQPTHRWSKPGISSRGWHTAAPDGLPALLMACPLYCLGKRSGRSDRQGRCVSQILARVPTGRLIVLGEPGAGKTVLMVQLVLDLLGRRRQGNPVPVLLTIGSWNPVKDKDLRQWITKTLSVSYPSYAAYDARWARANPHRSAGQQRPDPAGPGRTGRDTRLLACPSHRGNQ